MHPSIENETAVITGAGSGIGEAASLAFARAGANVVMVDVDEEALDGASDRIESEVNDPDRVATAVCDVTDSEGVAASIEFAVERFGGIDVLYNNAGVSQSQVGSIPMDVDEISEAVWDEIQDVNLKGSFLCAKYAVPHMRAGDGGVVINTSSASALGISEGMAAYSSAKGAIITLTEQLAADLAEDGIRVNAVSPGPVDTPMFRGGRKGQEWVEEVESKILLDGLVAPEDVANAAVFLASEEAGMVTGVVLPVDGGRTL
jgi:3-oxoacyl-[acyl-carrier protein] reductase